MKAKQIPAYLFSFHGRINRLQWWTGQLIIFLPYITVCCFFADYNPAKLTYAIAFISCIPLCWIDLALSAKRYHDINKSGWRQLIGLMPIIGELWVIIELGFLRGVDLPNYYGYPGVFGRKTMSSET